MATLEATVKKVHVLAGTARAAVEELRQHFPEDRIIYRFIARVVAKEHKTRVPFNTIKSSFSQRKRKMMQKPIAQVVVGMYQQMLSANVLDSDDFTMNPRNKGVQIIKSIRSMIPKVMALYPFGSERDLARWLSDAYSINLSLALGLAGVGPKPTFTRQVEMVCDNMGNILNAAERGEPYKIPPKYLLMKKSAEIPAETLNAFIDRAMEELLKGAKLSKQTRQIYRRRYIEPQLGNFTHIGDLIKLAEQVKGLYNIPEREDLYRFSVDYADIRVPWNREHVEQGRLTHVHRYMYVAALILKTAKRKILDISKFMPVFYDQYKGVLESIIERLRRKGIKPNQFGAALALPLGETPQEINEHYIKGKEPMSPKQFEALAAYK